jgi:hypothetical protein
MRIWCQYCVRIQQAFGLITVHTYTHTHRIILEWFLEKQGEKFWTKIIWLRLQKNGGIVLKCKNACLDTYSAVYYYVTGSVTNSVEQSSS